MTSHFASRLQRRTRKNLLKPAIAIPLLAASMACWQTAKPNQEVKPYTIQNDILGESLVEFQKNQKCILRPDANGVEGAQTCVAPFSMHYAGIDMVSKLGSFYQGRLYMVEIDTSTADCKKADMLSLLNERFGEPKLTETIDGREVTPAVLEGMPPFKIWQNGRETIAFQESMGVLDSCSVQFWTDEVFRKMQKLKGEEKRKKDEAKKKENETDM